MRNAMGSAWVFSICLTFIILFTAYLAITVNYAKAFRVKSHIVSRIEENEGYEPSLEEDILDYLAVEGYDASGYCEEYIVEDGEDKDWALEHCLGVSPGGQCEACIYRKEANNKLGITGASRSYYRVIVFFRFDLPVIKAFLPSFRVGGDSRYIYDFAN